MFCIALIVACGSDATGAGVDASTLEGRADPSDAGTPEGQAGTTALDAGAPDRDTDAGDCGEPSGLYDVSLTPESGDCGAVDDLPTIDLGGGPSGVNTQIVRRVGSTITTEVVIRGCSVRLTVTVEQDGARTSRLSADTLVVAADGLLSGSASFARFDAVGAETCSGTYRLVLIPSGSTVGAAASGPADTRVDAGPDAALEAEIEHDCTQTLMCRAQRGESLSADPLSECIQSTTALLTGDPQRQAAFLANRERCRELVACAYYDCALAP